MKTPACRDRQDGQTTTEYALLAAAFAVALIVALLFLALRGRDVVTRAGGAAAPLRPPAAQCDGNYSGGCVPPYPPDLNCGDLQQLGIKQVTVVGSDPHGLDPDGDGYGCN